MKPKRYLAILTALFAIAATAALLQQADTIHAKGGKAKIQIKGSAEMLVDEVGKFAGPRWGAVGAWDTTSAALMSFSGTSHSMSDGQFAGFDWAKSWQTLEFAADGKPKADATWTERKHDSEPRFRALASLAQDHDNHKVYLFGGFVDMTTLLNDLWEYDLKKKAWTQLDKDVAADKKPHVRDGAGFCFADDHKALYLWGGLSSLETLQCMNDLWKFDLVKKTWTEVTPKSKEAPSVRLAAHLHYVGKDKAVLMGGFDMTYQLDVWEIDLKKSAYKKLKSASKALTYSSSVYNPAIERILVTGGFDGEKAHDHVQLYDPAKDSWEDLGSSGHKATFSMCTCNPESGEVYLWGGCVGAFLSEPAATTLFRLTIGSAKDIKKLKKAREDEAKAADKKAAEKEDAK